jgi:glutathione S-transferase
VEATLYYIAVSHPSQAARKMLELKGVPFKLVKVFPLNQRVHLRVAGFRGGTVPALKVDGRRIQGSRQIARALDELWPEPSLFPSEPDKRRRVEDAERWGEQQLQPVPRRIGRYGAAHEDAVRRWGARDIGLPAPGVMSTLSVPLTRYYARTLEVDGRRGVQSGVRTDLDALPQLLERADALLADGTLSLDAPNAATFQVLASVRLLDRMMDLHELIGARDCAQAAATLFPDYPGPVPRFLPRDWLAPLSTSLASGRRGSS